MALKGELKRVIFFIRKIKIFLIFRLLLPYTHKTFAVGRGQPIDRVWIESYLSAQLSSHTISKAPIFAAEFGDTKYIDSFLSDFETIPTVLAPPSSFGYIFEECTRNQIILDLNRTLSAQGLLALQGQDLIICTQVLNFIANPRQALESIASLLNTNGIIVGSVSGTISPISQYDDERGGHFWGFTVRSLANLLQEHFEILNIKSYGSPHTAAAFVLGYAAEEFSTKLLYSTDNSFPVTICFTARRKS